MNAVLKLLAIMALAVFIICAGFWLMQRPGRYQLVSTGQGTMRIDTQTGQLEQILPNGIKVTLHLSEYRPETPEQTQKRRTEDLRQQLVEVRRGIDHERERIKKSVYPKYVDEELDKFDKSNKTFDGLCKLVNDPKFQIPEEWVGKSIAEIEDLLQDAAATLPKEAPPTIKYLGPLPGAQNTPSKPEVKKETKSDSNTPTGHFPLFADVLSRTHPRLETGKPFRLEVAEDGRLVIVQDNPGKSQKPTRVYAPSPEDSHE